MDSFATGYGATVFSYRVTYDGVEFSCSEVSGLDSETEKIEYRSGDDPMFRKRVQLGLTKMPEIEIKRAFFADDDRLQEVYQRIYDKDFYTDEGTRGELLIELMDEHENTVQAWTATGVIPTKLGGSSLKSDANELYFESMKFSCEDFKVTLHG